MPIERGKQFSVCLWFVGLRVVLEGNRVEGSGWKQTVEPYTQFRGVEPYTKVTGQKSLEVTEPYIYCCHKPSDHLNQSVPWPHIRWNTHSMHPIKWKCQLLSGVWLCDLMNCSPLGSFVPGILQARIPEWVGSHSLLQGIDQTCISCIAGRFFTIGATREMPIAS